MRLLRLLLATAVAATTVPLLAAPVHAAEPTLAQLTYDGPAATTYDALTALTGTLTSVEDGTPLVWQAVQVDVVRRNAVVNSLWTVTDADGRYRTETRMRYPVGEYELKLTADGGADREPARLEVPLSISPAATTVTATLEPGPSVHRYDDLTVHATLLRADDGTPAGEQVLTLTVGDAAGRVVRTSELHTSPLDGIRFDLRDLPTGTYVATLASTTTRDYTPPAPVNLPFEVRKRTFTTTYTGEHTVSAQEQALYASVQFGETMGRADDLRFTMRLLAADATLVQTVDEVATAWPFNVVAKFDLTAVPAGDYTVEWSTPGNADWEPVTGSAPVQIVPMDVSIAYRGPRSPAAWADETLSLRVMYPGGAPVPGATVRVRFDDQPGVDVTADADGMAFVTLPAGERRDVRVRAEVLPTAKRAGALFDRTFYAHARYVHLRDELPHPEHGSTSPLRVRAVEEGVAPGSYRPAVGLPVHVTVTDPAGVVRADGVHLTDATGRVLVTGVSWDVRGTWRYRAEYAGDATHEPAEWSHYVNIYRVTTTLAWNDVVTRSGQPATLSGTLSRADDGRPVVGEQLVFRVNGQNHTGVTDATGRAQVAVPLPPERRAYVVSVQPANTDLYRGGYASGWVTVTWAHEFVDDGGGGLVRVNPATRELQLVAGSFNSGVVFPGVMNTVGDVLVVHGSGIGFTLDGEFHLPTGGFVANGSAGGQSYTFRHVPTQ